MTNVQQNVSQDSGSNQRENSPVQIRHIRVVEEDGTIINNAGATVAYAEKDGGVHYAVAYCGPRDNFNRKIGRLCAAGRLVRCEHLVVKTSLEDFESILDDLVQNPEVDNHGLSLALNSTIGAAVPAAYEELNFIEEEEPHTIH